MKKIIYLSVPTRYRTRENIDKSLNKMKECAKIAYPNEEIEFVDNLIINEKCPEGDNYAIWKLSKNLEKLSKSTTLISADCPYFLDEFDVDLEQRIFWNYVCSKFRDTNLIVLPIKLIMERDEFDALKKYYNDSSESCKLADNGNCGSYDGK